MASTLLARRIADNLAWARPPEEASVWAEVRRLWSAPDDVFVRDLYPAALGRPAEDRELRHGLRFLAAGGERAEWVRLLMTSDEARRSRLDASWLPRLVSLSEKRCWAELVRLWPQPDELFVRGTYDLLLLRPPEDRDLKAGLNFLRSGGSRAEFVRLLTATDEFARLQLPASWLDRLGWLTEEGLCRELLRTWGDEDAAFVRRLFELFLHRPAGEREVADNVTLLRGGCARLDLARSLARGADGRDGSWFDTLEARLSEEIWTELVRLWAEPDAAFVRGLHRLVLRSPAEPGALLNQVSALRFGTSRPALVRSLAASEEGRRALAGTAWLAWLDSRRGRRVLREAAARRPDSGGARELLDRLPLTPDTGVFVRRAYLEIMGRQPTPEELKKQSQRLHYIPFYTRRVFLRRLLRFRDRLRGG
jgi:hypothetical protein